MSCWVSLKKGGSTPVAYPRLRHCPMVTKPDRSVYSRRDVEFRSFTTKALSCRSLVFVSRAKICGLVKDNANGAVGLGCDFRAGHL